MTHIIHEGNGLRGTELARPLPHRLSLVADGGCLPANMLHVGVALGAGKVGRDRPVMRNLVLKLRHSALAFPFLALSLPHFLFAVHVAAMDLLGKVSRTFHQLAHVLLLARLVNGMETPPPASDVACRVGYPP